MGYIAVVDYGAGNLKSVANAVKYLGFNARITRDSRELELADAIILPGVGAFPDASERLRASGLDYVLKDQSTKKPLLGICLGMQLLFDGSNEVRPCKGLGLIPGWVSKIETNRKLPHIGWNSLAFQNDSPIFSGLEDGAYVYFVHSFCGLAKQESYVTARTEYGPSVIAAVGQGNAYGCQFHPEKSGEIGLQILRNFGDLNR